MDQHAFLDETELRTLRHPRIRCVWIHSIQIHFLLLLIVRFPRFGRFGAESYSMPFRAFTFQTFRRRLTGAVTFLDNVYDLAHASSSCHEDHLERTVLERRVTRGHSSHNLDLSILAEISRRL
jgi:hypothetical protein